MLCLTQSAMRRFLPRSAACVASLVVPCQRRPYYHTIDADAIPPGTSLSRTAAAASPSERARVQAEYALSPIFGARAVGTVVGTPLRPSEFYPRKAAVAAAIDAALRLPSGTASLGLCVELEERGAFVAADRHIRFAPRADTTVGGFNSGVVAARTLCSVHFPDEWDIEEVAVFGDELRRIVLDRRDEALAALGVVHAEVPVADTAPFFAGYNGVAFDEEDAAAADGRWAARVATATAALRANPAKTAPSQEEAEDELEYELGRAMEARSAVQ